MARCDPFRVATASSGHSGSPPQQTRDPNDTQIEPDGGRAEECSGSLALRSRKMEPTLPRTWARAKAIGKIKPLARGCGGSCVNGAAAHLVKPSDMVIIVSYGQYDDAEAKTHRPNVFLVDKQNRIVAK